MDREQSDFVLRRCSVAPEHRTVLQKALNPYALSRTTHDCQLNELSNAPGTRLRTEILLPDLTLPSPARPRTRAPCRSSPLFCRPSGEAPARLAPPALAPSRAACASQPSPPPRSRRTSRPSGVRASPPSPLPQLPPLPGRGDVASPGPGLLPSKPPPWPCARPVERRTPGEGWEGGLICCLGLSHFDPWPCTTSARHRVSTHLCCSYILAHVRSVTCGEWAIGGC